MNSKETEVLLQQFDRCGVQHVFDQMAHRFDSHGVFDEVPADVIWDEDVRTMVDHDGLLQQLARGKDNFVGEHLVSAQQKQVPIQTSVIGDIDESTHSHSFDSDDGLLQLLAGGKKFPDLEKPEQVAFDSLQQGGENLIGQDKQSTADSNNISGVFSSVELNNDSVLLEEHYHSEVIWDDDVFSDLDYSGGLSPDQICCEDACESYKASLVDEQITQSILFEVNSPSRVQELVVVASAKVFADKPFKDDASAHADLATFIAPGASNDAAREVLNDMHNFDWPIFDEMPTVDVLKDAISSHDGLLLVHAKLAPIAMEQQRCDPLMAGRVEFATPEIVRFTKIVKPQWRRNDFSFWECELQLEDSSVMPDKLTNGKLLDLYTEYVDYGHKEWTDIKVVFSSTMVSSLYFQLRTSAGMGHHEQHRLAASIRRQWDPGIFQFIMQELDGDNKCHTKSSLWIRCDEAVCKVFLITATAWGQAVFRGGGNVMTRRWTKRGPRHIHSSQPNSQGLPYKTEAARSAMDIE
ncbi:unnamed protein product [Urochloa humidicola]